jgi:hypothetical protein
MAYRLSTETINEQQAVDYRSHAPVAPARSMKADLRSEVGSHATEILSKTEYECLRLPPTYLRKITTKELIYGGGYNRSHTWFGRKELALPLQSLERPCGSS